MPEVSRFFGISIRMYFDDHNPPHFHAIYAGDEIVIGISPLTVLHGKIPRRALGMAMEWSALHQRELLDNWDRLRNDEQPVRIDPLD
jgi:phosphomannomutase